MAGCKVRIVKPAARRLIELSLRKSKKENENVSSSVLWRGLKYWTSVTGYEI
jgi:hypothetical protein